MNTEMQRHLFLPLVRGLLVCFLSYSGLIAAAAITEVESPRQLNSWSAPQVVQIPAEGLTISARINVVAGVDDGDVDYFVFDAADGDTLSIKIVDALKPDATGTCLGFGANIALYDSVGGPPLAGNMGDCATLTEPSFRTVVVSKPGERHKYIIGVSAWWWNYFLDDGATVYSGDPTYTAPGGTYQLFISGVTPDRTQSDVPIDVPIVVRHWHQDERDLGKRNGRDPITVAILSTVGFEAMTVDPNSLKFGKTGEEQSLYRCRKHGKDINRDGRIDMVCYFKADVAGFEPGDMNGKLKGKTLPTPGNPVRQVKGTAALRIFSVPTERRGFKDHPRHHHDGDKRASR